MDIIEDYYKAYEKRYKQVYNENSLWSSRENTKDVLNAIETLNLTKNNKILDLGCGEGRDAIILLEKGYALIGTMGNGTENYESNINDSFDNVKRVILNNNKKINVAATSCKIVNWSQLENEIKENNLIITKKWISQEVPKFKNMMFALIKRK